MTEFFDDFLTRAFVTGIVFAIIAGPLGCFVIWQRLAYFGDSMAHSALFGVAFSLLLDINILIGVFVICSIVALVVSRIGEQSSLPSDSALGVLSHSTLALGLVLVSLLTWIRVDVLHFLFGNILAVNWSEILVLLAGGGAIIGILVWKWKRLICLAVSEQIASAENMHPQQTRVLMMIMLATIIAFAMKVVGIILAVALLIIPAATSRQLSQTPEQMAIFASIFGVISVIGGLSLSIELDSPPGPSIVVSAFMVFLACWLVRQILRQKYQQSNKFAQN